MKNREWRFPIGEIVLGIALCLLLVAVVATCSFAFNLK